MTRDEILRRIYQEGGRISNTVTASLAEDEMVFVHVLLQGYKWTFVLYRHLDGCDYLLPDYDPPLKDKTGFRRALQELHNAIH